jgi:hypothetical protein
MDRTSIDRHRHHVGGLRHEAVRLRLALGEQRTQIKNQIRSLSLSSEGLCLFVSLSGSLIFSASSISTCVSE